MKCLAATALLGVACVRSAPLSEDESGVALGLFASDVRYDYGPLLDEIDALGADDLLVAVPWAVPDVNSASVRSQVPHDAVRRTLRQARSRGLRTTVMPIVVLESRGEGEWRGTLDPREPSRFWTNYGVLLQQLARDAAFVDAERLVVGSELCALERQEAAWRAQIADVRAVFDGRVTYSANWDHYRSVPFWDAVDEVGTTAYFPVDDHPAEQWRRALDAKRDFAEAVGKPLIITEYGYPSIASAAERPWDETTGAAEDLALQAELYQTALDAMDAAAIDARFAWTWFGTGAAGVGEFSPRGRPAATVLAQHFTTRSAQRAQAE